MARLISLAVLTTLIVFLGVVFFRVIAPFLLPLFLAGVLAILCQPMFRWLLRKTGGRTQLAAGLTTAAVLLMFLVPLLIGTYLASAQLYRLAQQTLGNEEWVRQVSARLSELEIDRLAETLHAYFPEVDGEQFRHHGKQFLESIAERTMVMAGLTVDRTLGLLGGLVSLLVGVLMFVIALYYFLSDGPAMLAAAEELVPVHVGYQRQLITQFAKVVRAVVLATFLAALGQGLATALVLYMLGFHHFFILVVLATFASLIPLAGAWLVWLPCAVWLFWQGHWASAIFLTLFGSVVIGFMDNVIRTYVLHTDAKLHPLLAFVSVLGGLQVMGLWGMFIGPIVASCLHALVQIFNTELKAFSKERFGGLARQKTAAPVPAPAEQNRTPEESEAQPAPPSANGPEPTKPAKPVPAQQTGKSPARSSKRRRGKKR